MRHIKYLIVSLLVVILITSVPSSAADEKLPHYQLPIGRKLSYTIASSDKTTKGDKSDFENNASMRLTVVRENPDGSRRVIIRNASTYTQIRSDNTYTSPERVEMAWADVFPDGRVSPNPTLTMYLDTAAVLPPLPKDANDLAGGWQEVYESKQMTLNFKPVKSDEGEFVFTCSQDGMMKKLYAITKETTYHFDRAKGIIAAAELETGQDYGFHTKGTGTIKLESDETIAADEAAKLAQDFDQFFAAREKYGKLMAEIEDSPAKADELSASAKKTLSDALEQVKSEDAKKALAKSIEDHEQYAKYAKESADRFAAVLNKPAADWESTDIDGNPAKLADYRGKVVVMDFWYRGCGWCMHAMPAIKQIASDYKDKPVIVLGMNTDREVSDAKFVIDAMELKYPTIKAEGIPDKYGVRGFPTLIIIDQQGVVRDVRVGYSPTLRDEVAKAIDKLLNEKTDKTSG